MFPSLTRPAAALGAYGNGTGYLFGGYATAGTTPQTANVEGFLPIPGIVSYNIETGTWKNESALGYSTYGTAIYGEMQFVPNVGKEGLLVVLGGSTSDAVRWTNRGSNYISFERINMFDPATGEWHNQTASGTIPGARERFCSVGAQGDNGTYEIFIFGGHVASPSGEPQASNTDAQRQRNTALDEVFVLSLPGFVWTKADYRASFPRVNHACNIAGKRQMIVTGGLNPSAANGSELIYSRDPWTQGIGVFDMTLMEWKDRYDANAESYRTPEALKSWYAANGQYPEEWDDSAVRRLFTRSGKPLYDRCFTIFLLLNLLPSSIRRRRIKQSQYLDPRLQRLCRFYRPPQLQHRRYRRRRGRRRGRPGVDRGPNMVYDASSASAI
jgi:Kelch motif